MSPENPVSGSAKPAPRKSPASSAPVPAKKQAEAPVELTDQELLDYKTQNLLNDDDYALELRLQVGYYGEQLLNRVKYEVDVMERELVALASVFNEFLTEVKGMDAKINELTTTINAGKLQAAKELDETIKQEVQVVVDQLRMVPNSDLDSVEVLYQNLDALQDNYDILQKQIQTLEEIGVKTDGLQKNLPALEKGISRFGKSIEERQLSLLVGEEAQNEEKIDYDAIRAELKDMLQGQNRAMINHLRQTQVMANPREVEMLRRNQAGFEASLDEIKNQMQLLEQAGIAIADLQDLVRPVESGLKQFERALSSNQFLKITERIFAEVEVVIQQIREAQHLSNAEDLEILSENVEVLYENCDVFADELDDLAEQGLDIAPVLEHYDVLRVNLEQFERTLQDAANRIGLTSGQI
ncbi:hypothetical protein COW36_17295 [bacterium (Candidatus Blackallbacteria) CG17_big_fil_post_rev_8_21_14_2_50_48_46]|uniref:Uncharacterized protein n=1 Tax=bacterium (Candidatus Blackallbacteria) CG17_big_fil_post_rev_8_21_14_2_50_48_46 TaxID=2014261 RepID=A0A2M7G0I0_9BACT|nr:MAG: hypothetical protein COW64_01435 [bacterium (Candidatus Blackallbacteria) CG18_big_fil_WC_8_21_14_2_50_49_26]PIW15179.1 MAG: hypothetical protein COW36_17295 [bacterium (Candidatus Blackallbacteria) CG17_big_fil_post_rev_8_21_14_2_50_48_46]PIW50144.1 MAG: hypothetical protein COW20_03475 [bacterium (Candidatus Blackallbacteria) CG13_big_fil_rev_8_21_14_2_50_49_14]